MDVAREPRADLSPSAHVDTFCRNSLPPADQWPDLRFTLPELSYPQRLNCADALLSGPDADRRCLVGSTSTWTYGQVRERVAAIAHVLTDELGLVPGNRVLLRGPNTPQLAACWLAVVMAGGVTVATMPMLRPGELRSIGDITRPAFALCDDRFTGDLAAGLPDLRIVTYTELESAAERHREPFAAVATAADDVALLAVTSGTTGVPKTTAHFHRDVLAIADTFSAHVLRPAADDLFLGSPPLAFTYGLGGELIFPFRAGAPTLLIERPTPDAIAGAVAEHGVTVLFTAPTAYRAMLAAKKVPTGLRRCVSAGEPLPRAVSEAFHDATGLWIIDGIGSTEMLHIFISAADDDVRPGSTGRPVPGYEAAVLDEAGEPVPDGQPGRLAVRGPTGCRYLSDPRQKAYVQARLEPHRRHLPARRGRLFLVRGPQRRHDHLGRLQHRRTRGGERPAQLAGRGRVRGGGQAGPDRGNVVAAYVVLRPGVVGDAAKAAELQELVKRQIAPVQMPAGRRVPARAAAHPDRQAAAVQAARAGGRLMRIAVIGGGPGGLYFSLLAQQLGPGHEISVWERNAPDDTFGFGVVFSDETLGGIEHADPVVYRAMEREFARWDDIDIHFRPGDGRPDRLITSGGHGSPR
jgi:2-aminobenzoate-CoA ligase